jgi:anaerobic selenocysteine-containing dehydrogenase
MQETTLTRRRFIEAATIVGTALAAGSALSGCLQQKDPNEASDSRGERAFYTSICHGCIAGCPCKVYVEDGVVVKIEGHPDAPESRGSFCIKGLNQIHACYSPRRILYPMRRTGAKGAANAAFERVSWEEAIDYAATRIAEAVEQYGTYSVFSSAGGGGSYVGASIPPAVAMALFAPTGFEPGAAQCWMPRTSTAGYMYGGSDQSIADNSVTEPFKGLSPVEAAKGIENSTTCLVVWGTQPSASQASQGGRGIADLRARGCKTIVVDPNFSPDAVKATVHLPLRPGSDAALILTWYRTIFEEKLYDEEFTKFFTNLPFLINPDTKLPWLAMDAIDGYTPPADAPDNTPVYVCVDEDTGEVAALPFGDPAEVKQQINPQVFAIADVKGRLSKSAGQIYREEADPWTLEKAAEFCWVPQDRIRAAIDLYAAPAKEGKCAGIGHGVATDQMEISSQAALGLLGLDMIMGYVNKPGATLTQTGGGGGPFGGASAAPLIETNEWGKCAADGAQARPTRSFTSDYQIGYVVGATQEENDARIASEADVNAQKIYSKIMLDRLGLKNHRGLSAWSHSHIPAVREAIETGEPYHPRIWLELSGNKLAMLGSVGAWYSAAMNNVDFVLGQQPLLTSFLIEFADVVFPTEEWLEMPRSGMGQLNYKFANPGIVHLGESVSPMTPWLRVVEAVSAKLNEKLDKIVFSGSGQTMAELGLKFPFVGIFVPFATTDEAGWADEISTFGPTVGVSETATREEYMEALKNHPEAYQITSPPDEYWIYGQHLVKADDGLPLGFATESRKCEVYCTLMIKLGRTGWPYCYPYGFDEPIDPRAATNDGDYSPICNVPIQKEAPEVANADGLALSDPEFPLALTSGRVYYFHHGTMRHAPYARELYPVPFVRINPRTAAEYGIEDGDWVEISSRRTQGTDYDSKGTRGTEFSYSGKKEQNTKTGEPIRTKAYVAEVVAPNVLWMERFWNPECFDSTQSSKTGGWQECNVNQLTNAIDTNFNEVFGSYNYRGFAVNIKKSERPERIWVDPKEFEPFMPSTPNELSPDVGVIIENRDILTPYVDLPAAPTEGGQ